jgi:hypothetical protein
MAAATVSPIPEGRCRRWNPDGSRGANSTAPGETTVLYDGHCRFCTAQMRNLSRFVPDGAYDFQQKYARTRGSRRKNEFSAIRT